METSILITVKKMLGVTPDDTSFDVDILTHLNTVLLQCTQMGIGVEDGIAVVDDTATWNDFLEDNIMLGQVKTYVALKTRLLFDPPLNSTLIEAMNKQLQEIEWRLMVEVENV